MGQLQASTFQALAALSGKVLVQSAAVKAVKTKSIAVTKSKPKKAQTLVSDPNTQLGPLPQTTTTNSSGMALTVRIEINLPVADDQAVYDRIFKSIKDNLMNG